MQRRQSPEEHRFGRMRELVTVDTPATFGVEAGSDGTAMRPARKFHRFAPVSATAMSPHTGAVS